MSICDALSHILSTETLFIIRVSKSLYLPSIAFIIKLRKGQVTRHLTMALDGLGLIPGSGGVEIFLHSFMSTLAVVST